MRGAAHLGSQSALAFSFKVWFLLTLLGQKIKRLARRDVTCVLPRLSLNFGKKRERLVGCSPNQVLTHSARAAATQLNNFQLNNFTQLNNFQPLCGRARAKGSGQSK